MGKDQELEKYRERSEVVKVLRYPRTQLCWKFSEMGLDG